MFYKSSFTRFFFILTVLAMAICSQTAMAISNEKPIFNIIEARPVPPPAAFLNARSYQLTYFYKDGENLQQVYPSLAEKQRDYDLILARAVREYIEDEYFTKNKGMDEHVVNDSNKGEIFDLVSKQYLSDPWQDENINALRQFVNRNFDNMMLFTMNVYLDYSLPGGEYNSGNDINPILLKFSKTADGTDFVTFIQVNVSDK
ncbi:MAG: hypothetical protein ACOYXC_20050 [Candidatus Rifleibacteriota bacterium]